MTHNVRNLKIKKSQNICHCFPNGVSRNIVRVSPRNHGINRQKLKYHKISQHSAIFCGKFCLAFGLLESPLCAANSLFVVVSSYWRLYIVSFCLCLFRVFTKSPYWCWQTGPSITISWPVNIFLAGVPRDIKNYFSVFSMHKRLGNTGLYVITTHFCVLWATVCKYGIRTH